jgi:parvulin-like peptidyl-prolyl isomerase
MPGISKANIVNPFKSFVKAFLPCALATLFIVGCNDHEPIVDKTTDPTTEVLVKGKGVTITRAQLNEEIRCYRERVGSLKAELPEATVNRRVLETLIDRDVVLAHAIEADKTKAREKFQSDVKETKTARKQSDMVFEESLSYRLLQWGLSRERWEERMIEIYTKQMVIQREVASGITEEQIKEYYREHVSRFEQPEMLRANFILLATVDPSTGLALTDEEKAAKYQLAQELSKRVRKGEEFAGLARQYSENRASRDQSGAYTFVRGRMPADFESVVFALQTNEVSDVISTDSGYQLVQLTGKIPARTQPLSEVAEEIKESLIIEQIPAYLAKIKEEARLIILNEELKAAKLDHIAAIASPATEKVSSTIDLPPTTTSNQQK